jgi:hypothetical protein
VIESALKEALETLQHQVEHLERCYSNPNLEDETKAFLLQLASSKGKSLFELKNDLVLLSQKIKRSQELSGQVASDLESGKYLSYQAFAEINRLLADILDNYWELLNNDFPRELARILARSLSIIEQKSRDKNWVERDKESFELCRDAIKQSLMSAISAAKKVDNTAKAKYSEIPFQPKIPLGRILWGKRQKILESGLPPLTREEIEK